MLLTNRRHRILYIALAGMEIGWLLPFILIFINFWVQRQDLANLEKLGAGEGARQLAGMLTAPPLMLFGAFLLTMLLYMLAADLLNKFYVESPWRELIMILLVLLTSMLTVRMVLYPTVGLLNLGWAGGFFGSMFNFTSGRRPELALILINALLWFRVASNTDREFGFFRIGLSFRLGLLASILGGALLTTLVQQTETAAITYFMLFFGFGLTAVSLARMDEKAVSASQSGGALLPWSRLGQIIATVLVTLGLGWSLAQLYAPQNIRTFLGWFSPLWRLLEFILVRLLLLLALALAPLMDWTIRLLQRLFEQWGLYETPVEATPIDYGEPASFDLRTFGDMVMGVAPLRYALVTLAIIAVLAFIWLFFARTRQRARADEQEEYDSESVEMDAGFVRRGLNRLRDLADLIRRYGVGSQLLAAISVQNIYANVGRLARQRGYPRHRAQPPDEYLPVLTQAFPCCEEELARITTAYMRVDYGDIPASGDELAQLRVNFEALRESSPLEDE